MTQRLRLFAAASAFALTSFAAADSVMVRLAPGAQAKTVARSYGARLEAVTVDGRYAKLELPYGVRIERLRKDARVTGFERIRSLRAAQLAPTRPALVQKGSTIPVVGDRFGLRIANAELLNQINWRDSLNLLPGRSVRVAILDTGLADSAVGLWLKTIASKNFVEANRLALDEPTGIDSSGNGIADEALGHGTVVAGTVDLVAPQSQFIIARIADGDGMATTWTLLQGLQFAVENRAEVINISLAERAPSPLIDQALAEAERRGVTVVAAAGNSAEPRTYAPASSPTVIAVSAVDLTNRKATFSNWQPTVDVAAPGVSVIGRYWTGEEIQWAGTSFATAFVSGAIADALRWRLPARPADIRTALRDTGGNIDPANPEYKGKVGRLLNAGALRTRLAGW